MAFMKTNSVDITVNGTTYNSLRDFGLAIENTDYLKTPVQPTDNLVQVPGRPGPLDLTDEVFGEQYFLYRSIEINFGGIETPEQWDSVVSDFRNLFEGRTVKLVFENDQDWFWSGRCAVEKFDHKRALGTFTFMIPYANPFKHKPVSVDISPTQAGTAAVFKVTRETIIPTITTSAPITITKDGVDYRYDAGTFRDPWFRLLAGDNSVIVKGSGSVNISYEDGSL